MSHISKVFIGNINKIKRGANMPDKNWQFELEEYIKQGGPDKAEKKRSVANSHQFAGC